VLGLGPPVIRIPTSSQKVPPSFPAVGVATAGTPTGYEREARRGGLTLLFLRAYACSYVGYSLQNLEPRMFPPSTRLGALPTARP